MQKVGCFLGKYKSTTVFFSFLQTEMDEEQMDIVDANQTQADLYINPDAFARRAVTASDSTCPADGVSLALMSTLLLIPDSFCAGAKTILDS